MMTGEELKASILQMAMQGKLVEQRPEEGTGEELYQEIQKEKQRLVKEGKIKKGKKIAPISDDEIPFDIPETWVWVRLGEITESMNDGVHFAPKYISSGIPCYSAKDINCDKISEANVNYISEMDYENLMGYKIKTKDGSILITKSGSIGRSVVLDKWYKFGLVESVGVINLIQTNPYFIKAIFDYGFVNTNRFFDLYTKGIAVKHLTLSVLGTVVIPLPPLAEQKRIVAKIEELMPFVGQYAASSEKLATLNAIFPDQMKKSILQEAVQGKLVPQDPSDEPASVLLEKIAEEKKKLIKEGKIKKQKKLPPITEDEIPFEIPESWEWVRLNTIAYKIVDGTHHSPVNTEHGEYKYITAKNIKDNGVVLDNVTYVSKDIHDEIFARCNPEKGDVLLIKDGATTGVVTVNNLNEPFSMLSSVALIKCPADIDPWYVVSVLRSDLFYRNIRHQMKGTGITRITLKQIKPMLIPIPPISEQHRIVDKLQSILDEVEKLSQ